MTAGTVAILLGCLVEWRHSTRCHTQTRAQTMATEKSPGSHRPSTSAVAVPTSADAATISETVYMAATYRPHASDDRSDSSASRLHTAHQSSAASGPAMS